MTKLRVFTIRAILDNKQQQHGNTGNGKDKLSYTTTTLKLSSKLFANMKLNFEGQPMPLLAVMLSQAQAGEGAGAAAQAVPPLITETIHETRPESDQPQDHLSTTPRQQATPPVAPVFEHGQRSEPNIASFSRVHETADESLGGSFHVSPPRSAQAPPTGHTSGVDLDALITLANATVTVDSNIPPDGASDNPAATSHFPTDVPTGGDFAHHHLEILSMEK
ncbi:hypothetical protein Tco_0141466, partial [Tanacetum coccineum]